MRKHIAVTWIVACSLALSCADGGDEDTEIRALTQNELALVDASNAFGWDLLGAVVADAGSEGENAFVSPLSVSMALGMALGGARGDTRDAMAQTLGFGDLDPEDVPQTYGSLIDLLSGMDPDVTMEIANSVWIRDGFDVLAAFVELCQTFFDAAVEVLDFDDPAAVDAINDWVDDATHGLIDEILDAGQPIPDEMMMYLVNAIYFKGTWTYRFDPADTEEADFHLANGSTKTVEMMHLHGEIPYRWTEDYQAVDLPYGRGHFAMAVLLPREDLSAGDVIAALDEESWEDLLAGLDTSEQTVEMPRFELEYDAEKAVEDALKALGMEIAFDSAQADFTGITTSMPLWIGEVKHKTFVRVDEEGTEAAAVTSVGMAGGSAPDGFRVDRPFVVAIHDLHSGALLFAGRISDPPPVQ